MDYYKAKIIDNLKVTDGIYKLIIENENDINAGQFYMIKSPNSFLGRPISICSKEDNAIHFLYATLGKGTKEISRLKNDDLVEIIGPLGNGFDTKENYGDIAIVSGGIGIAPMLELCKRLKCNKNNKTIDLYAGFKENTYLINEINDYVDAINITVEKGNQGIKGYVTDILNVKKYDMVFCCGPEIMMKKVVDICKKADTNIYVSMEKHMACGVGACLVCTCKTKKGNKKTCKDGPVFNGYDIEF